MGNHLISRETGSPGPKALALCPRRRYRKWYRQRGAAQDAARRETGAMNSIIPLYAGLAVMIAASLAAHVTLLRAGLIVAALAGAVSAWLGGPDWALVLLWLGVAAANGARLAGMGFSGARFSDEEDTLRQTHFPRLGKAAARALIDQGHWVTARAGEVLIRQDEAVPSLFYLASGQGQVERDGRIVAAVGAGDLVGEATVLDGAPATASVVLMADARLWFVATPVLQSYLSANPAVAAELTSSFARALRGKLVAANARIMG